jgi:hypothetical protein
MKMHGQLWKWGQRAQKDGHDGKSRKILDKSSIYENMMIPERMRIYSVDRNRERGEANALSPLSILSPECPWHS